MHALFTSYNCNFSFSVYLCNTSYAALFMRCNWNFDEVFSPRSLLDEFFVNTLRSSNMTNIYCNDYLATSFGLWNRFLDFLLPTLLYSDSLNPESMNVYCEIACYSSRRSQFKFFFIVAWYFTYVTLSMESPCKMIYY